MTEEVIVKDHAAETDQAINLGTRLLLMVAVVLIKEEMAKVVIIQVQEEMMIIKAAVVDQVVQAMEGREAIILERGVVAAMVIVVEKVEVIVMEIENQMNVLSVTKRDILRGTVPKQVVRVRGEVVISEVQVVETIQAAGERIGDHSKGMKTGDLSLINSEKRVEIELVYFRQKKEW